MGAIIKLIGALVTLSAIAYGFGTWLYPDADLFGWRQGRLRVPDRPVINNYGSKYTPMEVGAATVVPLENDRGRECLIESIEFQLTGGGFDTPVRPAMAGTAIALPVNFKEKHYDSQQKRFRLHFKKPIVIPPYKWVAIEVAIVVPNWVGKTYIGTLTALGNDGQRIEADGVEVDVLMSEPESNN